MISGLQITIAITTLATTLVATLNRNLSQWKGMVAIYNPAWRSTIQVNGEIVFVDLIVYLIVYLRLTI